MRDALLRRAVILAGLAVAIQAEARADLYVTAGYDLFQTLSPGTTFNGVPFQGVSLNTYNFGGSIGLRNVGATDTIVRRISDASVAIAGQSATIPIEMLALQLQSVVPIDFGLGTGFYYITLQSLRGGPASTGQMTITFGPDQTNPVAPPTAGTFTSFFDVFFDVRLGSLNGPIAQSGDLILSNTGTNWSHFPDPNALQLNGVNSFLDGTDHLRDFFPGPFVESHPSGATHSVAPTAIPEPSTMLTSLLTLGVVGVHGLWLRARHASS